MRKSAKWACFLTLGLIALLVYGKHEGSWYMESMNHFTTDDICRIKPGMDIMTAWEILGRPAEYSNFNMSNMWSAQYRSGSLFVEILYSTHTSKVEAIFLGQKNRLPMAQSGACLRAH